MSLLLTVIYLIAAIALFIGDVQDYPESTIKDRAGYAVCCLLWPVCLLLAGIIIIQLEIEHWRNRHD